LRGNELSDDIIRGSKLQPFGSGSKDTFYKMLDAQLEALLMDKKTPFTESKPEVEAKLLDQIRDPSFKITEKDISDLVGKGLSIDDASRMIGMLDTFKDPWFKRIDMYLKSQLGWDGAFEKFVHPQGGIAYKLASDKLFDEIESEKLRGKDIYERGSEIAIPFVVDYWGKVLVLEPDKIKRMRDMLEGTVGTEGIDESLVLGLGKGEFITDDVRLLIEPPPLRGKIDNWTALPESQRVQLWTDYEAGKTLAIPKKAKQKESQPVKTRVPSGPLEKPPAKTKNKKLDPLGIF
ncbi:hypothetical protein LCGC14_1997010, partial [marine sediment metagenome]